MGRFHSCGTLSPCPDAADADDSGQIDLTDPIAIIRSLFSRAGPLPPPGPGTAWFDPAGDALPCR